MIAMLTYSRLPPGSASLALGEGQVVVHVFFLEILRVNEWVDI